MIEGAVDPEEPPRRAGRPSMPVDRVVGAAMALVDERGPDALTLRALATALGSSTATLYRRFRSRADLVDEVVDAVFGEVELGDGPDAPWVDQLTAMSRSLFDALQRHPNLAPFMLARIPAGPHAMRIREHVIRLLIPVGFTPVEAVHTYATLGRYVLGFGVQAPGSIEVVERSRAQAAAWIEEFPFDRVTLRDQFEFGLEAMLTGLRTTLDRRRSEDGGDPRAHPVDGRTSA